ncbi:MAG: hypothetical protein ACRC0L_02060, partial [Angustibacter sp.]
MAWYSFELTPEQFESLLKAEGHVALPASEEYVELPGISVRKGRSMSVVADDTGRVVGVAVTARSFEEERILRLWVLPDFPDQDAVVAALAAEIALAGQGKFVDPASLELWHPKHQLAGLLSGLVRNEGDGPPSLVVNTHLIDQVAELFPDPAQVTQALDILERRFPGLVLMYDGMFRAKPRPGAAVVDIKLTGRRTVLRAALTAAAGLAGDTSSSAAGRDVWHVQRTTQGTLLAPQIREFDDTVVPSVHVQLVDADGEVWASADAVQHPGTWAAPVEPWVSPEVAGAVEEDLFAALITEANRKHIQLWHPRVNSITRIVLEAISEHPERLGLYRGSHLIGPRGPIAVTKPTDDLSDIAHLEIVVPTFHPSATNYAPDNKNQNVFRNICFEAGV